ITLRLSDVPPGSSELADAYYEKRAALGLPCGPDEPLVVTAGGEAIGSAELPEFLRRSRATRISLETNTALCSALVAARNRDLLRARARERERAVKAALVTGNTSRSYWMRSPNPTSRAPAM